MSARAEPRRRSPPPPVPTLAEIRRASCWVWLYCNGCGRGVPTALAPFIIRWGADVSSDRLRNSARCAKCGARGASLQAPSWGGLDVGIAPFPVDRL
jgi:hypothetical protein